MLRNLLLTAIVAGSIGGVAMTVLQTQSVVPLILEAETYEDAAPAAPPVAHVHAHDAHEHVHEAGAWKPADGGERTAFTAAANVLTAIGFSLMLVACFSLRNRPVGLVQGILWGLAGFAAFSAAPALGLPPELPGSVAAPLADRQAWWLATAAATMIGLAVVVFAPRPWAKIAGAGLVLLPHLVGAPHLEAHAEGGVPAELAADFVMASLGSAAVLWLLLGGMSGWLYSRWGMATRDA
ncbi:MAG: CbtA family protein [Geminicoccaceae bacterium]